MAITRISGANTKENLSGFTYVGGKTVPFGRVDTGSRQEAIKNRVMGVNLSLGAFNAKPLTGLATHGFVWGNGSKATSKKFSELT